MTRDIGRFEGMVGDTGMDIVVGMKDTVMSTGEIVGVVILDCEGQELPSQL